MKGVMMDECCKIVSWHANILKREIDMSKDKKIKLDMKDISKLICLDHIIESRHSEAICLKLGTLFSYKGIDTTVDEYSNGEKFLILRDARNQVMERSNAIKAAVVNESDKENFVNILKTNKLYDKETKYLLCPKCHLYSVEYLTSTSIKEYNKRWWCKNCVSAINYPGYNIEIDDKDKYKIYKFWGIDALNMLTNESIKKLIRFVASYFKSSCVSKKDKCLYFDFFDERKKGSD